MNNSYVLVARADNETTKIPWSTVWAYYRNCLAVYQYNDDYTGCLYTRM